MSEPSKVRLPLWVTPEGLNPVERAVPRDMAKILRRLDPNERQTREDVFGTPDPNPNENEAWTRLKDAGLIAPKRRCGTLLTPLGEKLREKWLKIPSSEREFAYEEAARHLREYAHAINENSLRHQVLDHIKAGQFKDITKHKDPREAPNLQEAKDLIESHVRWASKFESVTIALRRAAGPE